MAPTLWINIIRETTIMSKQPFHSGKDKTDISECTSQVNSLSFISSCISIAGFFPLWHLWFRCISCQEGTLFWKV